MTATRILAWTATLLLVPALASADLAEALASEDRPAEDRARDADRKPVEIVAFLGVQPGDTVIDLMAAGGYYTEVLSIAVGETGTVHAQNPQQMLRIRDGAIGEALTQRLADDRLPNVVRQDLSIGALRVDPGTVDAALTALNFHDVYNRRGKDAAIAYLRNVYHFLEPGGVLVLIDHAGNPDADNAKLHRIDEALVKEAIEASPFTLDATSDVLRNPDDDHTKNVFDPEIRGKTDRFVLRLKKPEDAKMPGPIAPREIENRKPPVRKKKKDAKTE
ncbi:MAG: class I SAM-dependent methyltransferase [Myxococcota bacterium]